MPSELVPFDPAKFSLTTSNIGLDLDALFNSDAGNVLCVSNYPQDEQLGQLKYAQSLTPASYTIEELADKILLIEGFVITRVESLDDNGELHTFYRITLFEWRTLIHISSSSTGVMSSIQFLMLQRGMGVWNPPVRVKVIVKDTKPPRKFHQLQILPEEEPEPAV